MSKAALSILFAVALAGAPLLISTPARAGEGMAGSPAAAKAPAAGEAQTEAPAKAATKAPAATQAGAASPAKAATQARADAPPAPIDDFQAQKKTIANIRNVGTALFAWLTDQVDTGIEEDGSLPCGEEYAVDKRTGQKTLDLYSIPEITWEDLKKLLVPEYLQELPKDDGWGHPFEYRLNLESLTCARAIGIRSAGADGIFDNSIYTVEAFTPSDAQEDLVWADGYFIRWPQATQADRKPLK